MEECWLKSSVYIVYYTTSQEQVKKLGRNPGWPNNETNMGMVPIILQILYTVKKLKIAFTVKRIKFQLKTVHARMAELPCWLKKAPIIFTFTFQIGEDDRRPN